MEIQRICSSQYLEEFICEKSLSITEELYCHSSLGSDITVRTATMDLGFPTFNEGAGIPGYRAKWQYLTAKDKMLIVTAMNSKAKAVS